MGIYELLKGEKCKQNQRLEVNILDTPLSSKISSVTRQQNRWYRSTKDSLASSDWSNSDDVMIMPREHLSPGWGRSSFSIPKKMELKQREFEMRKPTSNNRQTELNLQTDFLVVSPVSSPRKYAF